MRSGTSWRSTLLLIVACVVPVSAWADDLSELAGTYKFAPEHSNDVAQAIEAAVEKMNFIKRPIARNRLSKTNTPYKQIRIELGDGEIVMSYEDRPPIRLPRDGRAIKWTREDGEVFDVSARFDGGTLVQTYQAQDGKRVNSFFKDADGSLHLQVEVSSPQLPQPVKYELVYRPAS